MASRLLRTSNGQNAHSNSGGVVLDTGALIALLHRALAQGRAFRVPAGASVVILARECPWALRLWGGAVRGPLALRPVKMKILLLQRHL